MSSTSTPTPPPKRGSTSWSWTDIMDRIRWPHVALAAIIIAGTVALLILLPDDRWGPIARIITGLVGGGGLAGTILRGGVLRAPSELPPVAVAPPRPIPRRDERREGHVTTELMVAILAVAYVVARTVYACAHWLGVLALLVVLGVASGCGANPLAMHVRAATVATSALEGVAPLVRTATEHRIEAECGPASRGDVACVHALRVRMAPELAAVDVPFLTAREALSVYVATLRLLLEADAGGDVDVLGAVGDLARRLVVAWPELVAALRPLGVELPVPPLLELAAAAIGGAR